MFWAVSSRRLRVAGLALADALNWPISVNTVSEPRVAQEGARERSCLVRAARALTDSSVTSACKTGSPRCEHRGRGKAAASRCCHAVYSWLAPGERQREGRPLRRASEVHRQGSEDGAADRAPCRAIEPTGDVSELVAGSTEFRRKRPGSVHPTVEISSPHVTHPNSRGESEGLRFIPSRTAVPSKFDQRSAPAVPSRCVWDMARSREQDWSRVI